MITYISDKITCFLIDSGYLKDEDYSDFDFDFRIIASNILAVLILGSIATSLVLVTEFIFGYLLLNLVKMNTVKFHSKNVDSCLTISIFIFTAQLLISYMITTTPATVIMLGVILLSFYSKDKLYIAMILISSTIATISYFYSINLCDITVSSYLLMMILQTDYCDIILRYYDQKIIGLLDRYFGS